MSEPTRRLVPADLREDALRIIRAAQDLIEFTGLYEDVYADDLSEEVVNGFEFIAASARGAANRQKALHEWSADLADSVNADLALIKVAEPPPFDDVEVPGSLLSETEALHYRDDHPFPVNPETGEEPKW